MVMMLRPQNHAWTQSHHLMKALVEAMLLLYDTHFIETTLSQCEQKIELHLLDLIQHL